MAFSASITQVMMKALIMMSFELDEFCSDRILPSLASPPLRHPPLPRPPPPPRLPSPHPPPPPPPPPHPPPRLTTPSTLHPCVALLLRPPPSIELCPWSLCLRRLPRCASAAVTDDEDLLKLQLKDTTLEFSWPVSKVRETFLAQLSSTPTSCSVENAKAIATLVDHLSIPEAKIGLASCVSAFLWLYSSIQGFKPATVVVTSELPLGPGLGSSASFCVALATVFLACTDSVSLEVNYQGWLSFGEKDLELVNKWAFEGEKIIHGKPSGIDNTSKRSCFLKLDVIKNAIADIGVWRSAPGGAPRARTPVSLENR
ncbi:hypothetical protein Fmac_021815 [Flemingia macrophylla]|uniref:mevalonate kinase n=1 Tax=Flemingia macrophylla TaxID=520843 RepID=A0ABD1LY05_9FABA